MLATLFRAYGSVLGDHALLNILIPPKKTTEHFMYRAPLAQADVTRSTGLRDLGAASVVRYRVLKKADVSEVQAVALKAWTHAYRKYGVPLSTIKRFVSKRYSTSSFEDFVFPSIERHDSQFYLAIDKGKIVGFSNVGRGQWGWELYRIYLLPEYIGKGIGKKLLHLAEDFLRQKGARKYHLHVYVKNKVGLEFYLRNGFVRLKRKDKDKEDICLEKKLNGPFSH